MYLTIYRADGATLDRLAADNTKASDWADDAPASLDIDKGWDLLGRFLADNDAAGLFDWAVPLGDETTDLGYGPPLTIRDAELTRLAERLEACTADAARAFLTSPATTADPPYPFFSGLDDDAEPWLLDMLTSLRAFVRDTVAANDGLLLILC